MPLVKVFDPYTGGTLGGVPPTEEVPALVLAPALDGEQSLTSSATTWTVEWPAPEGGDGSYLYELQVYDESGVEVTPDSGTDEGPYVIPVAAGKSYIARLVITDGRDQSVESSAMCKVANEASALGWEVLGDYDFTGLDTATLTGTGNVKKSGVNYGPAYKVVDYSSNLGTVTAGSTGVTVDGLNINSGLSCSFALSDVPAIVPDNVLWVDFVLVDVAEIDSGSDGMRIGIADSSANFSSGTRNSARCNYVSAGICTWQTETDSTSTNWLTSQTIHTTYTVSILVIGGFIVQMYLQQNTETLPSEATITAGGRTSARNVAAGTTGVYDLTSYIGAQAIWGSKFTIKRIRIQQRSGT